jgi:hypothetical protein
MTISIRCHILDSADAFVAAIASSGARLSMDGTVAWRENIVIE